MNGHIRQFSNVSMALIMHMLCVLAFMRESKIFESVLYLKHPIWFLSTFLIFTWNLPCKTSDTGLWEPEREKSLESLWKQTLYHVIITTVSFEMRKLRLKEAKWWSQCYMGSEPCRWEAGSGFLMASPVLFAMSQLLCLCGKALEMLPILIIRLCGKVMPISSVKI